MMANPPLTPAHLGAVPRHISLHEPKLPRAGQHDCIHVTQEGSCGSHLQWKRMLEQVFLVTLLVSSLDYQGNAFALEKQGCGKV